MEASEEKQADQAPPDQELFNRLVQHIGEFVETDMSHLTPTSKLTTSIEGMSSLKMAELVLYLEDCFGIEFGEGFVDRIDTIRDLMNYIEERRLAAATPA